MQIFEHIEQGSDEWIAARLGIPTASMFKAIMAKGEGKTRRTYLLKLAGEILTGQPMDNFTNKHMERGHEMEGEARELYAFMSGADVSQVGFIRSGQKGCSPDGMIGTDGLLEIKTKKPEILIDVLLKDEVPPEHKAQCQGQLWVAEREWIDFAAYWPGLPIFIKRMTRDEEYIAKVATAVDQFNAELAELVERVRAYGQPMQEAA
ncbi:MAG: putative exonuclease [Prokaryotic dsDNA virus sp.]|nr:MAG: putative exonuclease [Prokaryotic dsDNA virus sp.]|tara:strand:- start:1023 stop:1640 length:618 start_codon:yes stop_codon:yes gene_type:complete